MRWVFLFLLYTVRHLALSKVVVGVLSSSLAYLEDVPITCPHALIGFLQQVVYNFIR